MALEDESNNNLINHEVLPSTHYSLDQNSPQMLKNIHEISIVPLPLIDLNDVLKCIYLIIIR